MLRKKGYIISKGMYGGDERKIVKEYGTNE